MLETKGLSQTRQELLNKYIKGNFALPKPDTDRIPRQRNGQYAPLSYGQQQLWLLAQLQPGSSTYTECVTIHLPGSLDISTLEKSFNEILRRHDAWRTSFPMLDGQPVQYIHPYEYISLPITDVSSFSEDKRLPEALHLAAKSAEVPFDLENGPLLRPTLIRLSETDHRLFLTMHHIIFDGFSLYQIFLPELHTIYTSFLAGKPSPLPELPIQYTDFSAWQHSPQQKSQWESHLSYWKKQLADMPEQLELPTDRSRPLHSSFHGSMHPFELTKELTTELKALSLREGVTLYMVFVASLQVLLTRYTGQTDIVLGSGVSDRRRPELQNLLGFFLNTIVLRTHLDDNPSFTTVLKRVREVTLEAIAHQDVPFEELVKVLRPERNNGQNTLFQVLISLEPPLTTQVDNWSLTQMDVETNSSKFDLSLELDDRPEGLIGRFECNTDLFNAETIDNLAENWQTLLGSIVETPEKPISELALLTQKQRHKMLVEWNDTSVDYRENLCIHEAFEQQAVQTPDAVALLLDDRQMTYGELNTRANQLAHYLRQNNIGPEIMVGLCMDRSFEMAIGLLGILKAGGTYAPFDPIYPDERIEFILHDMNLSLLLTQKKYNERFQNKGTEVLCLDIFNESIARQSTDNLHTVSTPDDIAYILYTSGSTGRPKGTEIRHRSVNRLVFGTDFIQFDSTRTFLHMSSIAFDASIFELWGALLHGARCVLFPERIPTPKSVDALVRKHKITTAWFTVSLFNAFVDEALEVLSGIKQIITGGEALSVAHICRALEALPNTQLFNGYGPTEATTFACCYSIPKNFSKNSRSVPIGRPISNTQVYILDKHLQPVPIGVTGEIYLGGAGIARGYFKRLDLTEEKFIKHPFSDVDGTKLYKTGDLARYLPDGNIEYIGRADLQVKLRGFRVELGEIEEALKQQPQVREAVVVMQGTNSDNKHLVAYIVVAQEHFAIGPSLADMLRKQLPEYMIPSLFIPLSSLPLNSNGKVDRAALPAPQPGSFASKDTFVAPTTMLQYQLQSIWEELLHVNPIGIRDNFFDLGGHSLLAAKFVARLEQIQGRRLQLSTLFAGPTIEQLAEVLEQEDQQHVHSQVVAVEARGTKRPFFFLHGDASGGAFYCFPLSRYLGNDQPFYALEPYQFDEEAVPLPLKTTAANHIATIRNIQPEGPYNIGGFCNGALIAYEIAQQLQSQGQEVSLLALIDPMEPSHMRPLHRVVSRFGKLIHIDEKKQLNIFLRLRHLYRYRYSSKLLKDNPQLVEEYPWFASPFPAISVLRQDLRAMLSWLTSQYDFLPYTGKVTILSAEHEALGKAWQQRIDQGLPTEFRHLKGDHITCRTDYLNEFAEELRIALSSVE